MRIGLFIGSTGSAPTVAGQIQQVVQAELDGFDSFWFSQAPNKNDVLSVIAVAGHATSRIEMGTAVIPTFSRHPSTLTMQALTAHVISDGRLALGIGTSHQGRVEGQLGLQFHRPAQHMEEYLHIVKELSFTGKCEFSGELFQVNLSHQMADARPFPVMVAAHGPRMLRIAGGMADGAITWMAGPKTLDSYVIPHVNEAAKGRGRPTPRICAAAPVAVTEDEKQARIVADREYGRYNQLQSFRRMMDVEGVAGPADMAIVGDEADVERQLKAYADAGATDLMASVFPVGEDAEASVARTTSLLKSLVGRI